MADVHKVVGLRDLIAGVTCNTDENTRVELQYHAHLLVELRDARNDVAIAGTPYQATGPRGAAYSGETDDDGRFAHRDVAAGDYKVVFAELDDVELMVQTTTDPAHYHVTVAPGRFEGSESL
jgi:hypothetical protein